MPEKLYVIDGMAYAFRAYFAIRNLRDSSGRYHSLRKGELQSMERRFGTSLMPDYSELLTGGELTDLVAYLVSLRGA